MILHIDMDAFFASIEQTINPRLKGKPLIVGSRGNKMHTVVCAASYEAKQLGINSGMPTADAFKVYPNLEFIAADQSKYIWTSEAIFELLKTYGYALNYASIDEFQLDVPELNFIALERLATEIQKQIKEAFNITASIGIAKNCMLAKLGSKLKKPCGLVLINDDNLMAILKATPAAKIAGIGLATQELFDSIGIKTCLELYEKSPKFLEQYLGKNGINLYQNLHSTDTFAPQNINEKPKSISHSYTLERTSQTPGFIQAWIRLLSEMVASRLREKNLEAKTITLWLNGPEIGNFTAQKSSQDATNDGSLICQKCLKIMARKPQNRPKIRAIGVTASNLTPQSQGLLFNVDKKRAQLLKAVDKINKTQGNWSIYPATIKLTQKKSR